MGIVLNFLKKSAPLAVRKFRSEDDVMISYNDLEDIPLNSPINIDEDNPEAGEYIRIPSPNRNSLMFTVTMSAGYHWKLHHHNCVETCLVFKGHLYDYISKQKAGAAQILKFGSHDKHFVVAKSDSVFYVEFIKP